MNTDAPAPTAPTAIECPECGSTPMGEGCYHICSNSTHYYSPEQERYDDQFYGDDDIRERYMEYCPRHGSYAGDCGGCEADYYDSEDDPAPTPEQIADIPATAADFAPRGFTPADTDDIPF